VKEQENCIVGNIKNNGHDCSSNYTSALVSKATGRETNLKKTSQQKPISVTSCLFYSSLPFSFAKLRAKSSWFDKCGNI
jgi:hypothetical protein